MPKIGPEGKAPRRVGAEPVISTARGAALEGSAHLSRFHQPNATSLDDGVQAKALVKWFNVTKGFGFVAPVDGSPDAFLHISVLNRAGRQEITDGTEILCQIAQGPKGPQVTHIVEVLGGGHPASARDGGFGRSGDFGRGGDYGYGGDDGGYDHAPTGPALEMSGTVKWFKPDKGFGFVTPDDAAKDVFVHKSVLRRCGLMELEAGQRVQMKVQEAAKGLEATWIMPL